MSEKTKNGCQYIVCLVVSVILLLFFSSSTSPLYKIYYNDYYQNASSAAMLMGKAWLQGTIPYVDWYVTEGPLFYVLQAVGWLFGERMGIFFLQIINLSLFLFLMNCIFRRFVSGKKSWGLLGLTAIGIAATLTGGNSAQEFTLLFIAAAIYLSIRLMAFQVKPKFCCFLMGLLSGAVCMIQMTSGVLVYASTFCCLIFLSKRENKKTTFWCILGVLFGIFTAIQPFMIYFGWHRGLDVLLDGAILHHGKELFCDMNQVSLVVRKVIKSLPAILLLFGGVFVRFRQRETLGSFMMVIGISAACFSILGKGYWHFYLPMVGCFPLAIAIFLNFSNRNREWLQVIACGVCVCILYAIPLKHYIQYVTMEDFSGYESLLQDLKAYQDTAEDGDVFLVDIPAFVYLEADVIPKYRYSFLQSAYEDIVPEIREDVNTYVLDSCTSPVLIVQSGGWTYEQIGEYQMCALYYHGRKMIAVYEKE